MKCKGICTIFSSKRIGAPIPLYEIFDRCGICEVHYEKGKYLRCPCCHYVVKTRAKNAGRSRDISVLINKKLGKKIGFSYRRKIGRKLQRTMWIMIMIHVKKGKMINDNEVVEYLHPSLHSRYYLSHPN